MASLGEEFPKEIERVTRLLAAYEDLGPSGAFGAVMLRLTLNKAQAAQASGDVIAMIQAWEDMRGCE